MNVLSGSVNGPDEIKREKELAAEEALNFVAGGHIVGLGTGSTAEYFIRKLAERASHGLEVSCIASSLRTAELAGSLGLNVLEDPGIPIDVDVDGADEIDLDGNMIKGGGGALLREKIVASNSREVIILVDHTKVSRKIGAFPLPVEVSPFLLRNTLEKLRKICPECDIRGKGQYRTDNGNAVIDCRFKAIENPQELLREIMMIPGVIEVGLFLDTCTTAIVGKGNKVEKMVFKK